MPELNPDEQVWNWTKNGPLANRPADNTDWLFDHLVETLTVLQQRPDLLAAFVDHSGLQLKDESYQAIAA